MIYGWTREGIEEILIQIEQQSSVLKPYYFTCSNDKLKLLGSGGSSLVFQGSHLRKKKSTYAIKVILEEVSELPDSFVYACDSNIVTVYNRFEVRIWIDENNKVIEVKNRREVNDEEYVAKEYLDIQFFIMEELEPIIHTNWMKKKKLLFEKLATFQEEEILQLAYNIGNALAVTHERKLLHRDVKLENIFYDRKKESYKLGDFGIAKKTKEEMSAVTVAFTKGYGAPEVVTSLKEAYDHTADIYSLGMVLYVLLNDLKFPDSDHYHVNVIQQYTEGYVLPNPRNGSKKLHGVIRKMCAFNPDQRYQSMDEVLHEIDGITISHEVQFKKTHNYASLILGIIFWLIGVIGWNLIFYPQIELIPSLSLYLFFTIALLKGVMGFRNKDTMAVSVILFCISCYLLWEIGFGCGKFLLIIGVLFSGTISFLSASAFFAIVTTNLMITVDDMIVNDTEYTWVMILLLILSMLLLYEYWIIKQKDQNTVLIYFKNNRYWNYSMLLFFLYMICCGIMEIGDFEYLAQESIYARIFLAPFMGYQFSLIGLGGLLFSIAWVMRGKFLCRWMQRE